MDVKDFFYSGGVVACKDRTESDVVIEICRSEGFRIHGNHDRYGDFHGCFYYRATDSIRFYLNGSPGWNEGVSFEFWIKTVVGKQSTVSVEDLL